MNKKRLSELTNIDFPDMNLLLKETRRKTIETSRLGRYSPLPVRLATGRFYTNKEYKLLQKKVLSTKIP